jgi:hypothetical protein
MDSIATSYTSPGLCVLVIHPVQRAHTPFTLGPISSTQCTGQSSTIDGKPLAL